MEVFMFFFHPVNSSGVENDTIPTWNYDLHGKAELVATAEQFVPPSLFMGRDKRVLNHVWLDANCSSTKWVNFFSSHFLKIASSNKRLPFSFLYTACGYNIKRLEQQALKHQFRFEADFKKWTIIHVNAPSTQHMHPDIIREYWNLFWEIN